MQIHKRFTAEQVKVLLKGYCQGTLDRSVVEETFLGKVVSRKWWKKESAYLTL